MRKPAASRPSLVTTSYLRRHPLPAPGEGGKEERGRVLVVGGAREMPGAVILAANASLRAGAGKLQIVVGETTAPLVAQAVPEALVAGVPETKSGGISARGAGRIEELARDAAAVLVGPGMLEEPSVARIVRAAASIERGTLVLDAAALSPLRREPRLLAAVRGRAILTPHAGEMAAMTGLGRGAIERAPVSASRAAAKRFGAVVALKGAETYIAEPSGRVCCNRAGNAGLATSGSGDTLSGIVAGLAARGAAPALAAAWGVALHARAGDRLARRMGPLGFLPRELLAEIPKLMAELGARTSRR